MGKKYSRTFGALFVAALAGTANADDALTYKGVPPGATMEQFRSAFPDYRCSTASCDYSRTDCVGPIRNVWDRNEDKERDARRRACNERNSLGGASPETARAEFMDGKLATVSIMTSVDQAGDFITAATSRYGSPDILRSPAGVPRGAEWKRGGDVLTVVLRAGAVGESLILLQSAEQLKQDESRRTNDARKAAKDF